MKTILFFMLTLSFATLTHANVGDYFASSASTMSIAGQLNFDKNDPANNQYAGSILANSDETSYSFNIFAIDTNFSEITNVVVSSPVNSSESSEKYGDVDTDYNNQYLLGIHGSFKVFKKIPTKLNLSLYIPTEKMLEASTGDPYRPEYVMYRTRFQRMIFLANIAHRFDSFNISIGGMSGFQSNGETYIVAKDSGSTTPSSGKMTFNARPSMALTFSLYKEFKNFKSYFSFQDEMKSQLTNNAGGYTPIGASSLKYEWDLSTMLYYDPRIYRLGSNFNFSSIEIFTSLEYQDWSGYQSPILQMENQGGILISSQDNQNFKTQNILIPKIGAAYKFGNHTLLAGVSYRPTPLKLTSGASGNSVDTDAAIFSLGHAKNLKLLDQQFKFSSAIQYHQLQTVTITKNANRENGDAGQKIGAGAGTGGYQVGGSVLAVSFGLSWLL